MQPWVVLVVMLSGCGVEPQGEVIADGGCPNGRVALGEDAVYWACTWDRSGELSASVRRVPLDGGPVTTIATGRSIPDVAVRDGVVYWANWSEVDDATGIWSVPVTGGTPTHVHVEEQIHRIAVDANRIYFTTERDLLFSLPLAGGTQTLLAGEPEQLYHGTYVGIAVDRAAVYWADTAVAHTTYGAISKVPIGGGASVVLAGNQGDGRFEEGATPRELAIDEDTVYWCAIGAVGAVPKNGGAPRLLTGTDSDEGSWGPGGIAVAGDSVYWSDTTSGGIREASKSGGKVSVLTGVGNAGLVVDDSYVYFATFNSLRRIPR